MNPNKVKIKAPNENPWAPITIYPIKRIINKILILILFWKLIWNLTRGWSEGTQAGISLFQIIINMTLNYPMRLIELNCLLEPNNYSLNLMLIQPGKSCRRADRSFYELKVLFLDRFKHKIKNKNRLLNKKVTCHSSKRIILFMSLVFKLPLRPIKWLARVQEQIYK